MQQLFRPIYDALASSIFDVSTDSISLSFSIWKQHLINNALESLMFDTSTDLI